MPPTASSFGTFVPVDNDFQFPGEWWITILPGTVLALITPSLNRMGDWVRRALDTRFATKPFGGTMGISTRERTATTAVFAFVAAVAVGGCASTDYHYSQLYGTKYYKTNIDTYPVSINSVDGRNFLGHAPVLVDPGIRSVVVQGPPTFVNLEETRTVALDVKACTRYYLVAVKPNRLDNDFTVRVDYEEPVAGCTPPAPK